MGFFNSRCSTSQHGISRSTRPLTSATTLNVSGRITWSSRVIALMRDGSIASQASAGTIHPTHVCTCRVRRSFRISLDKWTAPDRSACSTDKDGRWEYNKRTYALQNSVRELYKSDADPCHIEPRERDLNSFVARLQAVKARC